MPNPFENPREGLPRRTRSPRGQRGMPKRSTPASIENWERDVECVRLRKQNVDWDTITERLGYTSKGNAHDRYLHVLKEYPRDDVETMRDAELIAIEMKCNQLEDKCAQGDPRAVEVWNKLSERKSKLCGWDQPERKEITVLSEDAVDKAIREAREELERANRNLPTNIPTNHPERA